MDEDFPPGTELTQLQREHDAHAAFAEARQRVYIGRGEYFTNIDKAVEEHTGIPFVILGESGIAMQLDYSCLFESR